MGASEGNLGTVLNIQYVAPPPPPPPPSIQQKSDATVQPISDLKWHHLKKKKSQQDKQTITHHYKESHHPVGEGTIIPPSGHLAITPDSLP